MSIDLNLPLTINIQYTYTSNIDYCLDNRDNEFCSKTNITDIEAFERVMDTLDKEWFKKKERALEKVEMITASEICDVCTKRESEDDPILVCQGCGVSVHRDCYGSSYDKEEFFLCQCCIYFYLDHSCIFCKNQGGVMKMTSDFKFGHILCVLFDKSLDFDNAISREPIFTGDYKEVEGPCMYCNKSEGTKIECSFGMCMNIYHMGCSLEKVYYDVANNISYCSAHDPTLRKNLFTSNASFKNLYSGYVKLHQKPIIRLKRLMHVWHDTDFNKENKSEPEISRDVYDKLKNDFNDEFIKIVCRYWICKRTVDKKYGIQYLRHSKN